MDLSDLPPLVLENIMALMNSHKKCSHLGQTSKFFLNTLIQFRITQKKIHKMHKKRIILDLFKELTDELSEKFHDAMPDSDDDALIDITHFMRELHILDISSYDEKDSRQIVVKRHKYYVELIYKVPIAESSRTEHETHRMVFRAPDQYHGQGTDIRLDLKYVVRTHDDFGNKDSWSPEISYTEERMESPCELVCLLLDLPWDTKTMHK